MSNQAIYIADKVDEVVVIVMEVKGIISIHFRDHPKLSGKDRQMWFPIGANADLNECVELIMQINNACKRVDSVELIKEFACCTDYLVKFKTE